MLDNKTINKFNKVGYVTIDNFLPIKVLEELNNNFKNCNNWDEVSQTRPNHYKTIMKSDNAYFPNEDETFYAKFLRSTFLEKQINHVFENYFVKFLKKINNLNSFDNRCYKMESGCHYRSHIDDYTSRISTTFYINKSWVWDWGGILHLENVEDMGMINSIFPKYNRLVIMNQEVCRLNHFVSPITDFAQKPRYTMVSFNG